MKIDQNVTSLKNVPATRTMGTSKTTPNGAASGPLPAANQALSASSAPSLPSIHEDFNAARVAEIRASISAGRYQVNTAKIADGLLATVRDLLSKGTR